MADKPLKSITFPGLTDKYMIPEIDSTLTQQGVAADAKATGDEISDVKNTLNHKADIIYDTASGDIASFPDGADGLPVKDLTVAIEPVQDLHGYDSPWPAGGGKNKINPNGLATKTDSGITYTKNSDGSITATGTASSTSYYDVATNLTFPAGSYILTGGKSANRKIYAVTGSSYSTDTGAGATFTTDGTKTYKVTIEIASGQDLSAGVTFKPMVRLSTESDATFTPYSNICPISGWTGCNVTRTGKELYDKPTAIIYFGSLDIDNLHWTYSAGSRSIAIPCLPNTSYIVEEKSNATVLRIGLYDGELPTSPTTDWGAKNITAGYNASSTKKQLFTTDSDTKYIIIQINQAIIDAGTNETFVCQGATLPISWQSEAGTVYGGTLDVTSGVLTVDRAKITFAGGNEYWDKSSITSVSRFILRNIDQIYGIKNSENICDSFKTLLWSVDSGTDTDICILCYPDGSYQTQVAINYSTNPNVSTADFKSYLSNNNVSAVFPLITPLYIQLNHVTVTTLLGQNNVWADCGPSTVEYPADTKLYIQKINTPTDDDMIADANIASGQYFIVNNNLYLSTAAILAGDPIKPGTNCTLTNLAAALNALNS